jgi:DNA mismatch repair ATPase MutL
MLLIESGYTDVLDGTEVEEPDSSEKKAKQEEEKETADESQVSAQATELDGDSDDNVDDDNVDDDQSTSNNQKKQKPSSGGNEDQHERESPTNDIHKVIAENCTGLVCGGGLVVFLLISLTLCYGCYKCCCETKKSKAFAASYTEVELSNGYKDGGGSKGYTDEFADEEDENDDDDAEYGVTIATH